MNRYKLFKELIPNWRYWLSHQNAGVALKWRPNPRPPRVWSECQLHPSGFGETTNIDSEVSISILKRLKLKNSCINQNKSQFPTRQTAHRRRPTDQLSVYTKMYCLVLGAVLVATPNTAVARTRLMHYHHKTIIGYYITHSRPQKPLKPGRTTI